MSEDGISPLSSFSLGDSEKEEVEGSSIMVGFDHHQDYDICPTSWGYRFSARRPDIHTSLTWA